MSKMPIISKKKDSKKGVSRFALVAFKDLLESHVKTTNELSGPKSMGIGATVKTTIHGNIFKGTIVSMADNETNLNKQSQSFDVNGFFGFPKSRRSSGRGKHLHKKISIPSTNKTAKQLTSTPSSSKHRRLSVINLPSPIKPIKTSFNNSNVLSFESQSTAFTSTTSIGASLTSAQLDSVDDVDNVTISLVEASYDDDTKQFKLNKESNRNQSLLIKDVPDNNVDLSMNFSSFSSTFDSLQNHIHPLIGVTRNMPNYQPAAEISSLAVNVEPQHEVAALNETFTSSSSVTSTVAASKEVSKCRRSRIPVVTSSKTTLNVTHDPLSTHVTNNINRTVHTDVYLHAFFPPTPPCSLPSINYDSRTDFDETFNVGGRSETTVAVIPKGVSEDELTSLVQTPTIASNESEFPSKSQTPVSKFPVSHGSLNPQSSEYAVKCNTRMYDLDSEGNVNMMAILDNERIAPTQMDTSEPQYHSYMNSSNKENVSPKTEELVDAQIKCDQDRFLQITPI